MSAPIESKENQTVDSQKSKQRRPQLKKAGYAQGQKDQTIKNMSAIINALKKENADLKASKQAT